MKQTRDPIFIVFATICCICVQDLNIVSKLMKNVQKTYKTEISCGHYPVPTWGGAFFECGLYSPLGVQIGSVHVSNLHENQCLFDTFCRIYIKAHGV